MFNVLIAIPETQCTDAETGTCVTFQEAHTVLKAKTYSQAYALAVQASIAGHHATIVRDV
jgi:hypothetical protein